MGRPCATRSPTPPGNFTPRGQERKHGLQRKAFEVIVASHARPFCALRARGGPDRRRRSMVRNLYRTARITRAPADPRRRWLVTIATKGIDIIRRAARRAIPGANPRPRDTNEPRNGVDAASLHSSRAYHPNNDKQ